MLDVHTSPMKVKSPGEKTTQPKIGDTESRPQSKNLQEAFESLCADQVNTQDIPMKVKQQTFSEARSCSAGPLGTNRALMPSSYFVKSEKDLEEEANLPRGNTFTVYLFRHGEAAHNVLEKSAMQRAKEQAARMGLSEKETERRMEQARRAVLCDESLRDASLSRRGCEDAGVAQRTLQELIATQDFPAPSRVLVSPLTRAMETADLIFPSHSQIHVREEIQERQTGKPCDSRVSSDILASRPTFNRFCMDNLRARSYLRLQGIKEDEIDAVLDDTEDETSSGSDDEGPPPELSGIGRRIHSDCRNDRPHTTRYQVEEDKAMLRMRTRKLFHLLAQTHESSVAVVTHKGYLRELERGSLGNPSATEFSNGEVRVYRIRLDEHEDLLSAERVV